MAYLIEIPLLPLLGFPHTPFLTVIANLATLSIVSGLPVGSPFFSSLIPLIFLSYISIPLAAMDT